MTTPVATDFLKNLKPSDKVLVCFENGEVYAKAEVSHFSYGGKAIEIRFPSSPLHFQDRHFAIKNGVQRGGDLRLQPYDEARWQTHVDAMEIHRREINQRRVAQDAERRDSLKTTILSVSNMIDDENLDRLSTSDLQTLATLLKKLDEA